MAERAPKLHKGNRRWAWIVLISGLLLTWLLDLLFGSVRMPISSVLKILAGIPVDHPTWGTIILDFRLPKSITAILSGSALSIAGLQMQTLFRNPLADPYILGISSGASLGAAIVILLAGGSDVHFLSNLGFGGCQHRFSRLYRCIQRVYDCRSACTARSHNHVAGDRRADRVYCQRLCPHPDPVCHA